MLSMWLFGAGFVGALMVAWAARTPLPDCPGVSTVIVDALFTTNQKPQLFHNWTNVYTRTLELPPFTPVALRINLSPSHKLAQGAATMNFMLRSNTSDFAVLEQHICRCDFCGLGRQLPLERHSVLSVLDLGGNCGLAATVLAAVYPNARVVTVEPGTSTFQLLAVNTAHNRRIQAVYGAAWGSSTLITLNGPIYDHEVKQEATDWATSVGPLQTAAASVSDLVPAWAVDDLLAKYHLGAVDVLKVDVEGSEAVMFRDSKNVQWLRRVKCLVIEWHHRHLSDRQYEKFKAIMDRYGLKPLGRFGEHEGFCRPQPASFGGRSGGGGGGISGGSGSGSGSGSGDASTDLWGGV
ncbi:hypothetical protein CHLRE_01g031700v5 [Chlamydomonas reinhardtii]|uniref:Methyltransferase FkbM domain-containing protein n=1 Tax=Chlamydomonas reinhardtii TaxID=3055 RepID=A0A2K3E6W6_CHLRE|nr:uncharacterized protein CHLRE_01g031700v5 [Chlamydomonas reinhardtii]XP_042928562.1 uncharacterized protein CHLRE_01g031700v5 [Chlamydomonas reinhardtii]PNW88485.1 hypothetical protein CHLRE_01g031700v5 [Chlamydomonas reinhardtii]PNW88487.1 hypothetical protein CHLRE_01g031700v5 [Chlamydomonas reinhardtii]